MNNIVGPEMSQLTQERLRVLLLNTKNRVMAIRDVYQGTVNSASITGVGDTKARRAGRTARTSSWYTIIRQETRRQARRIYW